MERTCIPELVGPYVQDHFFKVRALYERYVAGPYGLQDLSDYTELLNGDIVSSGKEYWMFVNIFKDGVVSDEEFQKLEEDDYHPCFIEKLREYVGFDGANPLRERVKWLGDNCDWKWYRENYTADNRAQMVLELGEKAKSKYLTSSEALYAVGCIKAVLGDSETEVREAARKSLELLGYDMLDEFSPDRK